MEVQATGEAFSPQKRTSSTYKHEISSLFSIIAMQIRIQPTKINADLDQNTCKQSACFVPSYYCCTKTVLRIRIRGPVLFYLDLGSGMAKKLGCGIRDEHQIIFTRV
jgi:hypothetical protein